MPAVRKAGVPASRGTRPPRVALLDRSMFTDPADAVEFISTMLEASTEYSIIGKELDGTIVLWNEGARRIYGYEPAEVVGVANGEILHAEEEIAAGVPTLALASALADGKWEGMVRRRRKDGATFPARVVITPRRDSTGTPVGFLLISKDISAEEKLNDELRSTQFYTRSLIESNIDALMTTDPLGVITDVNEEMARLTGYSRADLIGSRFRDYVTEPDAAEAGIREVLRQGRVTNYELTVRNRDSRQTVVSYNATTLLDEGGALHGVFAAARDVTEHKALEAELRESQAYNRGLIEASVDGLITVARDGTISDVNEEMSRMAGYPREELIGTSFAEYFVDAEHATAGVRETFERGVVTDYVLSLSRPDGAPMLVSFNASVFRGPDGDVRGIFASARDITEQSRLQEQLADERAYNRGLIEASLDGLITVDPMLVITDVNDQMCLMAGYPRGDLIGSRFDTYFTDGRRAAEGVRLTLDQGEVTNYQLTLRQADGTETLVSFNAAVFAAEDGSTRGIFASARDTTEQSRLQEQLAEERTYNRGLIEASVDGLVTVDADMRITDVNDTMCTMVGRRRSQLIGAAFPSFFVESELASAGVRLTFEKGLVTDYRLTLLGPAGSLPISFNAAIFRDAGGEVRGIFASARDITAYRTLEQQARESQSYTRSLIESNIDALMTTDPLGMITDVNEQMVALTGVARDRLVGSPFKSYFTDPERAERGIQEVLRDGRVTNYELTARSADGAETVVSYNASTFFDHENRLRGVFAAARAVTEQKELERQLREQQVYLRGLIESSLDGLVTVDPDGYVSDVNEQMCRMAGYTRQELMGTPFADYFTDAERAREGVRRTFAEGMVTEYALTLVARGRRILHVSFNASVFRDADGEPLGIFASARDITDRVRLEDQLREQQTYLRGLIEASIDGLVTVDPEGFITDVNDQLCRMAGRSREELVGSSFKRLFTDQDAADLGVRRTLAEGVVANYELVLLGASGRKSTVSFNASVFRAIGGSVQGVFASARDISEQARLQAQLTEHQAYNRSLIEASADALFAIAGDGVVTDVNEEATRLTGYSRRHLVNSDFDSLFTDPASARTGVERSFSEGRVLGYELVLTTRHGRRVPVSFNAGVYRDAAGTPVGILASARDITAQRALEQQLRDSQLYTRTLIESNIDALMTTDPLGTITDVNEQMEALTGRPRDELVGTAFKTYFTDADRAEDAVRLALRAGKVENYELTARSRSGTETVVSYNATTFTDRDGKLQGVFAAARDVTDRKRFEQELQETNQELERASQAKDGFLASMSHELRTPLNAIIGFTGTLLMGLPGELNEEQRDQVAIVANAGKHLLSIINDLLDLAKIESGKEQVDRRVVVLAEVVAEAVAALEPLATAKGLKLHVGVPAGATALADRRALHQVVLNLLNNAVKFTDAGRVEVAAVGAVGRILLTVSDTGIGIGQEDQAALFQAFSQVHLPTMTHAGKGTGLGLYISQRLTHLMNGTITLASAPGKGSTFTVDLPAG